MSRLPYCTKNLRVITKCCCIVRFSNGYWKTKAKAITLTNHNMSRQCDEPITIPSNYLQLTRSAGKITRTWCDWFWFWFSLVENWRESFKPSTKRSNCNHVIGFDSHLKTVLFRLSFCFASDSLLLSIGINANFQCKQELMPLITHVED